jgi:cytochrome c peroxidase
MKLKRTGWLLALVLLIVACKKKDADGNTISGTTTGSTTGQDNTHKTTPYKMVFPDRFGQPEIPADNPMTVEGVKLGRYLFYDSTLSKDGSLACASCHKQANGFSDAPHAVSHGVKADNYPLGTANAMPVFNLAWSRTRFFWDGRVNGPLEEQILKPIQNPIEMHMDTSVMVANLKNRADYKQMFQDAFGNQAINGNLVAKAIAQFLRSIISAGSLYDQWQDSTHTGVNWSSFTDQQRLGYHLIASDPELYQDNRGVTHRKKYTGLDCFHCHKPPLFTPEASLNVMQNDGFNNKAFKVPTLRNLGLTGPYMNDGSVATMDSVLAHYNNGIHVGDTNDPVFINVYNTPSMELDQTEVDAIKAFLNMLNDNTLATNKAYSNPFAK